MKKAFCEVQSTSSKMQAQVNLKTVSLKQKMDQMSPEEYAAVLIIDQNEDARTRNGATNEH